MGRGEQNRISEREYTDAVNRTAEYIAAQLALASRSGQIARVMPAGFRRDAWQREADIAQQRAVGAADVLGFFDKSTRTK